MSPYRYRSLLAAGIRTSLLATMVLLVGCLGGASLNYHLIDPQADAALTEATPGLRVQILDVQIPRYLDRNPVVSRDASGQVRRSDSHHWGDSLRHNLMRTAVRDLSTLLASDHVGSSRDPLAGAIDYRILITVLEFGRQSDDAVVLEARWQIVSGDGDEILRQGTRLRNTSVSRGIPAQVRAMEQLHGELMVTIARTLLAKSSPGASTP